MRTEFAPRLLTDIAIGVDINKSISVSLTASNIFNVYPKYKIKALNSTGETFLQDAAQKRLLVGDLTFNGRYPYMTYDGAHINQLGTTILGQISFKF